jgi:hypothetical protein
VICRVPESLYDCACWVEAVIVARGLRTVAVAAFDSLRCRVIIIFHETSTERLIAIYSFHRPRNTSHSPYRSENLGRSILVLFTLLFHTRLPQKHHSQYPAWPPLRAEPLLLLKVRTTIPAPRVQRGAEEEAEAEDGVAHRLDKIIVMNTPTQEVAVEEASKQTGVGVGAIMEETIKTKVY